jgi:hypothetical protein
MLGRADNFQLHNEIDELRAALLDVMNQLDNEPIVNGSEHWAKYGHLVKEPVYPFNVGDTVRLDTTTHLMYDRVGEVIDVDHSSVTVDFGDGNRFSVHPNQLSLEV